MKNALFFDVKESEKASLELLSDKLNLRFESYPLLPGTDVTEDMKNASIISVFTPSRLTADILSKFKNLELVATRSVGFSHIDTEYCEKNNIKVVNTPHYGDYTVAEFSFALLLNLVRKVGQAHSNLKAGDASNDYPGMELFNKTIGIIGLGGIGSKAAKIANGFSMKILACDIYENEQLKNDFGVEYVDIDSLCKNADIISLHAPATKENYHLISAERIKSMKEGVVIVNTARGELIDTQALYEALLCGKVKGAALDVLECEEAMSQACPYSHFKECDEMNCMKRTLINHKMLLLPNVIATSHIAYDTVDAVNRILEMTIQNISDFSDGKTLKNEVAMKKVVI